MFNFLFDGSIGNMLAPIQSPTQQYQLAIQHHRNDEARHFIQSGKIRVGDIVDCGLADIHVACRFNNQLILELLLSQGLDVNLSDKSGNTPLHYASRFGNIDICRYLVALKARTGVRNASGQSPYDVAESHIVRQFLLPLQFQEEANNPDTNAQQQRPQDPFAIGGRTELPTNVAPPPLASSQGVSQTYSAGSSLHSRYVPYPGTQNATNDQSYIPKTSTMQSPPQDSLNTKGSDLYPSASQGSHGYNASGDHLIRPDGFGSSHTDIRLQQKYGNVKESIRTAPPPVETTQQPHMSRSISNPENASISPPSAQEIKKEITSMRFSPSPVVVQTGLSSPFIPSPPQSSSSQPPDSNKSNVITSSNFVQEPRPQSVPLPQSSNKNAASSASYTIKPDGFGSSHTDVRLQQKYGNVKEIVSVAPPPTMGYSSHPSSAPPSNSYGGAPNPHLQSSKATSSNFTPPPFPYAMSSPHRGQAPPYRQPSNDSSEFSTIDLDSNSSAMM